MPHRSRRLRELQKSCASSANLFAFICGPPWTWIDWSAVFRERDRERGLARVSGEYRCNLGRRPHGRDRLPRKYKLADVNRNALHPGDQHMIPAPGIEDQELSVAAKRPGVNNPAITRRCDLGSGPGCQRNAFFYATSAVGTAKIANLDAVNRELIALGGDGLAKRNQFSEVADQFLRARPQFGHHGAEQHGGAK